MRNFLLGTHIIIVQLLNSLALGAKLALQSAANVDGTGRVNNLLQAHAEVHHY